MLAGCTLIESLYQAVRCPLQLLPVGEPLASPWRREFGLRLAGTPAGQAPDLGPDECVGCCPADQWLVDGICTAIDDCEVGWNECDPAATSSVSSDSS